MKTHAIQAINLGMSVFLWSEYNFINIYCPNNMNKQKNSEKVLTITIKIIILFSYYPAYPVPWYHYFGPFLILISSSIYFCHCNDVHISVFTDCLPIQVEHLTHISSCFLCSALGWRNYQVIFSSSRQGCPTSRPWAGTVTSAAALD